MIASGANVKAVQSQLGHKTATMTLDQYGHLFPDDLDDVADKMDDLVSGCAQKESRPRRKYPLTCFFSCGAAGNRTRYKNPAELRKHRSWLRQTTRKYVKRPADRERC